ncbi:MAG: SRPBCC family protein [Rhizobiales bacterium]|nr:SRPBCC family protein [Hyphomicrobiales bacterium]
MTIAAKSQVFGEVAEPYATMPAPATLSLERSLPAPIDLVWAYLTESGKRAKWFAGGPMEPREGGAVTLTFRNGDLSGGETNPNGTRPPGGVDHVMQGVIIAYAPPLLLAFNWSSDGTGSEAAFELTSRGPETRLVVTHRRLDSHKQLLGVAAGWHTHIGILIDLLSERPPRRFWPEHARLLKVYEARFAS